MDCRATTRQVHGPGIEEILAGVRIAVVLSLAFKRCRFDDSGHAFRVIGISLTVPKAFAPRHFMLRSEEFQAMEELSCAFMR